MNGLCTIGYEKASFDDFLATLKLMEIDVLLDIREIPLSRRSGFSKSALCNSLQSEGVQYKHAKVLGSPKVLRDRLRQDGDYEAFFKDFKIYLNSQAEFLHELVNSLKGKVVVLMCYERDYRLCHRFSVANALAELTHLKPQHLGVQSHEQRKAHERTCLGLGQSVSAA